MSNLDPQNHYQPWSQKLQNLIDVSDDIVTMMSGTDEPQRGKGVSYGKGFCY
jgi:hypothetical protein